MEVNMKKSALFVLSVLSVLSLLLGGCAKKTSTSKEGAAYYADRIYEDYDTADYEMDYMVPAASYALEESSAYDAKSYPSAANSGPSAPQRMIQRSASINIQVMDPVGAAASIIDLTEKMGGFVISSTESQEYYSGDIYLPKADLSIRVPAEKLMEMLSFIENLTSDTSKYVSNKRIYGVDITSEYVDTNSRLTSLEKTRDKLYEILDTAANAEEALEVYESISDVESDIEVYKGQIKYMEESVALSSIDIRITSVRPEPTRTVKKWNPLDTVKDAFESLLDSGKDVIEYLIYFFIAVLPILLLCAAPVVLIIFLIKKLIRSKKAKKLPKETASAENKEDVLTKIK